MSEYQYYEFAAVDRPLTRAEMEALRRVSARAKITPSGFVNHYEWGDLKADPADWMQRYFDAFVYSANWCNCELALRLPLAVFRKAELKPFAAKGALSIEATGEHWICHWLLNQSENSERFAEDDGRGWMRRLLPLREELLRGDRRSLYLGWLANAGEFRDAALEPEVPPGLSDPSPAQQALVEFLEIDPDLLAAAMAGSGPALPVEDSLGDWLGEWSRDEMEALVTLIVQGGSSDAERRVKSRHAAWLKANRETSATARPGRSVAELYALAETVAGVRRQREAKQHARREARDRRLREAQLRRLMANPEEIWKSVEAQAKRGAASGYDSAARILVDLAKGYAVTSSRADFDRSLQRFMAKHGSRGALRRRLVEAGLWPG